jgi:hypothetical protein
VRAARTPIGEDPFVQLARFVRLTALALVVVVTAAGLAVISAAAPASAADPPQVVIDFDCFDGPRSYVVPAGITQIPVVVEGAGGGGGWGTAVAGDAPGGLGGEVSATLLVEPGQVLELQAGCEGADGNRVATLGGAGGDGASAGGDGGNGYNPGGGGGGSSAISSGGDALIVAGGGGGGGGDAANTTAGGDGGGPNAAGSAGAENQAGCAGQGGTLVGGGAGGTGTFASGAAGNGGTGGDAADGDSTASGGTAGGGGGAGYWGGGGAGAFANTPCGGGGGGSTFVDVGVEGPTGAAGTNGGHGSVTLTLPPQTFTDVSYGHPFYDDIEWMSSQGISSGYEDHTFRPGAVVTRQAMSAFMYRLVLTPAFTPPPTPTFTDVGTTHPFFLEVEWMADEGISTGYPGGTYRPAAAVTRQAMSAFLYRLAGEPPFPPSPTPSFSDVGASHPFYQAIEWMSLEGISTGYPDGTFKPSNPVTRQAMAAFMHRFPLGP